MHGNPWLRRFQPGTEIATRQGRLAERKAFPGGSKVSQADIVS
jgi:hypothetical protein